MKAIFEPNIDALVNSSFPKMNIAPFSFTPIVPSSYVNPIFFSNTEESENKFRNIYEEKIKEYMETIIEIISRDEFIDGETSKSSTFMKSICEPNEIELVKEALMRLFTLKTTDSHVIEGILVMISSVPYDIIQPQGPIMALGLLQNKDLQIRDRAIQCYEKWNSKKGLAMLKSLDCHPKWLQKYVEKVIMYIEKDGLE